MRALLEGSHLAEAQLVKNFARLLIAEIVHPRALKGRQIEQGALRQDGRKGQRLPTGDQAITPEDGHEPRQPCGRQRMVWRYLGEETQGGQVDEATLVELLQGLPVTRELGRLRQPGIQTPLHVTIAPSLAKTNRARAAVKAGRPLTMGFEMDVEAQSVFLDGRGAARRNPGLADKALAPAAQHETS